MGGEGLPVGHKYRVIISLDKYTVVPTNLYCYGSCGIAEVSMEQKHANFLAIPEGLDEKVTVKTKDPNNNPIPGIVVTLHRQGEKKGVRGVTDQTGTWIASVPGYIPPIQYEATVEPTSDFKFEPLTKPVTDGGRVVHKCGEDVASCRTDQIHVQRRNNPDTRSAS